MSCGEPGAQPGEDAHTAPPVPEAVAGVTVHMDFEGAGFYDAGFPSDHRVAPAAGFPNPHDNAYIDRTLSLLEGVEGFGTTSGVLFRLSGAPPSEPSVAIIDLATGESAPITVDFRADPGPFGAPNLLVLLPVQGIPLRPATTYAAIVRRTEGFGASLPMAQLAAGVAVPGLEGAAAQRYASAMETLAGEELSGIAVFSTGDPTRELRRAVEDARGPDLVATPFELTEGGDGYSVYEATVEMPVFQAGEPPFTEAGGGWRWQDGALVPQGVETARILATVPDSPMPAQGYPTVVFIRTGGGGDRPLVERGPAAWFAAAGFAGLSVDGPHGGLRNITGDDEQFLMFNVTNPEALRDNVRQSALEIALFADLVGRLEIGDLRFDDSRMGLMGHSMGATIAPLVLALEPRYRAVILSGAGGSWIENLVHKQSPVHVKPFAEAILGYAGTGYEIHTHDPALSLVQWAGEGADPPVYGDAVGAHVLMLQGIVDTYILPPIANATSLSLRLDLAGEALDEALEYVPASEVLPLVGRGRIDLPAQGNRDGITAVVVQHAEDGVLDGHEVVFQREAPQRQIREFLTSLLEGTPRVVP